MRIKNLRQLRRAAQLSVAEIAQRTHVSADVVVAAEDGRSLPDEAAFRIFGAVELAAGGGLQSDEHLLSDGRRRQRKIGRGRGDGTMV
jgi:transcriptional regulator with XRE-family HTH domain